MDFRYPKEEKLKSKITISRLFTEGKSVAKFPLRLVYVPLEDASNHEAGVSVSKKYFKKAVDRNYFKRVLRETYRLNKSALSLSEKKYAFMLFYQTAERLPFPEIETKMVALLKKFATAEGVRENPSTH